MNKIVAALALAVISPFILVATYAIGLIVYILMAIPFYFLWNWAAPIYFTFLPPVWMVLPFWHIVGLFWVFGTLKHAMLPSTNVTNNNNS